MRKLISLKGATLYWKEQIDTDFIDNNTFSVAKDALLMGNVKHWVNSTEATTFNYFKLIASMGDSNPLSYIAISTSDTVNLVFTTGYDERNIWHDSIKTRTTPPIYYNFDFPDINEDPVFIKFVEANTTKIEGGIWGGVEGIFKNPVAIVNGKVRKVIVDNVNMTIDIYTKEVPSEPETPSVPTDLTGYNAFVPSGWTATAGFGIFDILGSILNDTNITATNGFGIGYSEERGQLIGTSNSVAIVGDNLQVSWNSSNDLNFIFLGGSDLTNSTFIQWLVDNNAEFSIRETGGSN